MRQLENEIKDKVKKIREVEKNNTLLVDRSLILEDKLKEREKELESLGEQRRQVYLLALPFLLVSFC
jgi:hypothetical protein